MSHSRETTSLQDSEHPYVANLPAQAGSRDGARHRDESLGTPNCGSKRSYEACFTAVGWSAPVAACPNQNEAFAACPLDIRGGPH